MTIFWKKIWAALNDPAIYQKFSKIVADGKLQQIYVTQHLKIKPNDRVLDIGCGPADILSLLPAVDYYGFDMNEKYIKSAQSKLGSKGKFFCQLVSREIIGKYQDFDVVMANGVLHHLSDNEAKDLLDIATLALKPEGRLVTLDGVFTPRQSFAARYIVSRDRGRFVRDVDSYLQLAQSKFSNVTATVYDKMLRIPYTHITMEMWQSSNGEKQVTMRYTGK